MLRRQMGYSPSMNAREYIARLMEFNTFYGQAELNAKLPRIETVPPHLTIGEYQAHSVPTAPKATERQGT